MDTKIPAIVAPSSDTEGWTALVRQRNPGRSWKSTQRRETFAKDLQRNAGRCSNGTLLHRYLKARSGAKTRPKARRREQGTEVKLCPLRLNTTEGALKKEARFNSTANGPAARGEHAAEKAAQGRQGSERSRTAPKPRAT